MNFLQTRETESKRKKDQQKRKKERTKRGKGYKEISVERKRSQLHVRGFNFDVLKQQ